MSIRGMHSADIEILFFCWSVDSFNSFLVFLKGNGFMFHYWLRSSTFIFECEYSQHPLRGHWGTIHLLETPLFWFFHGLFCIFMASCFINGYEISPSPLRKHLFVDIDKTLLWSHVVTCGIHCADIKIRFFCCAVLCSDSSMVFFLKIDGFMFR